MSDKPRDESPKYSKSKEKKCVGCGSSNDWEFRQPVCRFHTPEKEAELQSKLHFPTAEFVTRPVLHKVSGRNPERVCELATLMEMLVIPEPEPEELPVSVDIVGDTRQARDSIQVYRATHSSTMVDRLPALHRPRFNPPSATFPEVVNLTLEFSLEAEHEIGRRLFEYFELIDRGYYNGAQRVSYELRREFKDTCRFDFKTRFPNLKLLTVVEHIESGSVLLPLFLLPPTVRVLRTNRNIFEGRKYSEFLSNVPRLSDVLMDFKLHNTVSATEEPSLKRNDVLRHFTEVEVASVNLSVVPKLRRLRFTDAVVIGKFNPAKPVSLSLERALELCSFLDQTHAPPSLESLEFPASSNFIKVNMACAPFKEFNPERQFQRLLDNFRCVFPRKIQCVDVSCPYSEGPRGHDTWEQKRYIIMLVDAFERCYFEDVVSHRLHHLCAKLRDPSAAKSRDPLVAVENSENLKRNLRMFLGGCQFGLPATFADKVIYQVEVRFRDALRTVASEISVSVAPLSQMSSKGVSVSEMKHDKAMRIMMGKRMESSYFSSFFEALRPKSKIFTERHAKANTEPRSCGCDTCQIVMNAGIDRDLNRAARIPFSISGMRSMEEYDAIFDSMRRGRSTHSSSPRSPRSPRSPHSPSPRHTPTYSSRNRRTRSRNPSPAHHLQEEEDNSSPKSWGSAGRGGGRIKIRGKGRRTQRHKRCLKKPNRSISRI
jgi:hypothetical protein